MPDEMSKTSFYHKFPVSYIFSTIFVHIMMEHSLCYSMILLQGRHSVISFIDLSNHDEFTEQQLYRPLTLELQLLLHLLASTIVPLQSIFQTKAVRMIFSKCKQLVSFFSSIPSTSHSEQNPNPFFEL